MNKKLLRVVAAIDDCVGVEIPYPTAKKMGQVSQELKHFMEECAVEAVHNKSVEPTCERCGEPQKGHPLQMCWGTEDWDG